MSGLRIAAVTSLPSMKTRPCLVERDRVLGRERGERVAVVERDAARGARARSARGTSPPCRGSGSRAARRAAVRPCSCRPLRARRWRRSSGSGRLVSESSSSKKPGKLTAAASAPSISTPSRETSPATAPSIAIRWSPRASIPPPRSRVGTPRTVKPSSVAADVRRRALRSAVDHRLDPVGLLRAQLGRAAERRCRRARAPRAARRAAARRRAAAPRRLRSSSPTSSAERTSRSPAGSPPIRAPVEDGDARAHPLEHVEQAGAARVEVDAVDRAARSRRAASPRR